MTLVVTERYSRGFGFVPYSIKHAYIGEIRTYMKT